MKRTLAHKLMLTPHETHNTQHKIFQIHWEGWATKWDEWADESRVIMYDESGLELQAKVKEELKAQMQKAATAKVCLSVGMHAKFLREGKYLDRIAYASLCFESMAFHVIRL